MVMCVCVCVCMYMSVCVCVCVYEAALVCVCVMGRSGILALIDLGNQKLERLKGFLEHAALIRADRGNILSNYGSWVE